MTQIEIKQATPNDIGDIARIHIAGWQAAYADIVDSEHLQSFSLEERKEQWDGYLKNRESRTYLALIDGKVAGFSSCGRIQTFPAGMSRIRPTHSGELYALYLLPDYYRRGLGTALIREAAKGLGALGHKSMLCWCLEKNTRAQDFYKAMDGQRIGKHMIEIGPGQFREICYGWRDIAPLLEK